jgi:2-(1,2-epoxy-1,2-dihydrophenyl)acetyl-CoA isomerase
MNFESIEYRAAEGVARIALNRPDKLNAFNEAMHGQLASALDAADADPAVRCLLLTGNGRGFCAGQDLGDRNFGAGEVPDLGRTVDRFYNRLIRTITDLPMPVVCAVNGVAAGAGANVALACDIVLAARSATFIQAFCRIGLIPDSGGTWALPRLVGRARASALALLGERVGAEQAEQWGMIWRCVDDDRLETESMSLATHLASQPTRGLALIKRALKSSSANTLDEQLDLERDLQSLAGRTADYREGVAAFLDKRAPRFSGA